jgi:hypothetical protein
MIKRFFRPADKTVLIIGAALLAALTGCSVDGPNQRSGYRESPAVRGEATVVIQDDYDYYPAYETYYSRNRHEYVYREGNSWVRRPQPRGVAVNVLLAAPAVRVNFRDSPEKHHADVVRSYPKNWTQPGKKPDNKGDRKADKKDDKKPDDKRN